MMTSGLARTHSPVLAGVLIAGILLLSVCSAHAEIQNAPIRIAPKVSAETGEPVPGTGFIPPPVDLSHIRAGLASRTLTLPSRFDWREAGMVTSVKHQGYCGSCYAFASIGCFEARLLVGGEGSYDLSENNVKECEWHGASCSGGNFWMVTNLLSTRGTVLEECDPYIASDVECKDDCPYQQTLLDWWAISGQTPASVEVIKSYLQTYGPVYTTMYCGNGDAWYSEYASYDGSYTMYYTGTQMPNHAVLIVGWDDNLSHAGGQGAWIVKNSWGSSWGGTCGYGDERGYFTIAYGSARMGSHASFVNEWQDYDPDGGLLYHDEAGLTGCFGFLSSRTAWGLCRFETTEATFLDRVEFWVGDATTDVDIYVYDDFSGGAPHNLMASSLDHSFEAAGYHSVKMAEAPPLSPGDPFYVVLKVTTAASSYPLSYDGSGPRVSGSSYYSSSGSYFNEFTPGDLGIRARVTRNVSYPGPQEAPDIIGVSDVPGDTGGFVNVSWTKSIYDDEESTPAVNVYRVWRRRKEILPVLGSVGGEDGPEIVGPYEYGTTGPAWELVATAEANGSFSYEVSAPTLCDSSASGTCWTTFCVTAHTGTPKDRYVSEIVQGYSVDDQGLSSPPPDGGQPGGDEEVRSTGPFLGMPEPNPSSNGFSLQFGIAAADWVEISIYDVAGREVARIVNSFVSGGQHSLQWRPGSDGAPALSPGLYFLRMVTSPRVQTEKLMIVK
jgi:C1A family cysteine protease